MAKLQISLVVAVLFVVGAKALGEDKCALALGKHPFDKEKVVGTWYVIAQASNLPTQQANTCERYDLGYFKSDDGERYRAKYYALDNERKERSYEKISIPHKKDRNSEFLGVDKSTDSDTYEGVFREIAIATDYDNYGIFMRCRTTFDPASEDFRHSYMVLVLSRKPTLNEDIKNTLINVASGYDIDVSEFKTVEHKDCPQ